MTPTEKPMASDNAVQGPDLPSVPVGYMTPQD